MRARRSHVVPLSGAGIVGIFGYATYAQQVAVGWPRCTRRLAQEAVRLHLRPAPIRRLAAEI
jgi:hypothetical protein